LKMEIFQPVMLVFRGVPNKPIRWILLGGCVWKQQGIIKPSSFFGGYQT